MAPYMVRPDHPRQPYMVRGDTIWRKGTIHGAADGPAGPTVGGTIYGMTASPLVEPGKPGEASDDSNEPVYPKVQQVSRERRGGDYKGRPERLQCYCCGSREHLIRYCPNKRCTICGTLDHRPSECPRKPKRSGGQRDAGATFTGERREPKTTVKNRIFLAQGDEDAVTIEVYIGPHKVEAILDTGARPSVIDINTAHRLGLPIIPAVRRVYGLCNNPVRVNGYVEAMVQVGGRSPVMERIEVLDSDEPTLLLGRRFMEQLGQVTFDWVNGRVRFGRSWITVHKTLSGATPLARARVAKQDEPVVATISAGIDTMICTKLTPRRKRRLGN